MESFLRKVCLWQHPAVFLWWFPLVIWWFKAICLGPASVLSWFLCKCKVGVLLHNSVYEDLVFPASFVEETVLSPEANFISFTGIDVWEKLWGFYSDLLIYMSFFPPLTCNLDYNCPEVYFEIWHWNVSSFAFIKISLIIQGLVWYHVNASIIFPRSEKKVGIMTGMPLNLNFFRWYGLSGILILQSMNMEDFLFYFLFHVFL